MRRTVSITLGGAALLAAGLLAGCTGGGDEEASRPTTPAPATSTAEAEPPAPLVPSDFVAEPTAFAVELTWNAPPEAADRFELFRDGSTLALVPGTTTSYTDEDVAPGQVYNYEIASQTGDLVSGRLHQSVETPVPPLRAARLQGTFDVKTRFVSQSGYGDYERPNFGWRFRPRCAEGPCNVRWSDIHLKPVRGTLKRSGARYQGGFTGRFILECAGSPVTSEVTLDLRVTAAEVIGSTWRATRLRGTLDHSESVQLGCGYSEAQLAVRARLVR